MSPWDIAGTIALVTVALWMSALVAFILREAALQAAHRRALEKAALDRPAPRTSL